MLAPAMVRAQLEALPRLDAPGGGQDGNALFGGNRGEVAVFLNKRLPPAGGGPGHGFHQRAAAAASRRLAVLGVISCHWPRWSPQSWPKQRFCWEKIATVEDLRAAATRIFETLAAPRSSKGGIWRGTSEAVDFLYTPGENGCCRAARHGSGLHGTGCTYSAAITAWLARGCSLEQGGRPGQEPYHTVNLRFAGNANRGLRFAERV